MRRHICLVGAALCENWQLVTRLVGRHGVTLLRQLDADDTRAVSLADVVAIDCRDVGADGTRFLVDALHRVITGTIVVLDGGLNRDDIAKLFSAGAQDYFSEPFNIPLIAERLEYLAESKGGRLVEDQR